MDIELRRKKRVISINLKNPEIQNGDEPSPDGWQLHSVEGLVIGDDGSRIFKFDRSTSAGTTFKEFVSSYGEWISVWHRSAQSGEEYLVLNDPIGYAPIFYTIKDGTNPQIHLAPSFEAIAVVTGETSFDAGLFASQLVSNHRILNVSASSTTFNGKIRLLGENEALLINASGIKVIPRPGTSYFKFKTYDFLVDLGIKKARAVIRNTLSASKGRPTLYLSGGRDSRVVLALIIAEGLEKDIEIVTRDPDTSRIGWQKKAWETDLAISGSIVEYFGLEWQEEALVDRYRISRKKMLSSHQSYMGAWNYDASLGNILGFNPHTRVSYRGGAGELLREAGFARSAEKWTASLNIPDRLNYKSAHRIADRPIGKTDLLKAVDLYDPSQIIAALRKHEGAQVGDAANSYFQSFRQRAHFGHHMSSLARANEVATHPLAQIAFKEAAKRLPQVERLNGYLVFDIIERCVPELNNFKFDDGFWNEQLFSQFRPMTPDMAVHNKSNFPFSPEGRRKYKAATNKVLKGQKQISINETFVENLESEPPIEEWADKYIDDSFEVLNQASGSIFSEKFTEEIKTLMASGVLKHGAVAGKLATARAAVGDLEDAGLTKIAFTVDAVQPPTLPFEKARPGF